MGRGTGAEPLAITGQDVEADHLAVQVAGRARVWWRLRLIAAVGGGYDTVGDVLEALDSFY